MKHLIKKGNFWIVLGGDIFLLFLAYFLSFFIRFEASIPPSEISNFKNTVWLIILFKLFVFSMFNLYRGMWRYTSISDLINIIKATFVSSTIIILTILYLHRFEGYPRSVLIIDAFLTLVFIGGIRLFIGLIHKTPASDLTHLHGISFCGASTRFGLVSDGSLLQYYTDFHHLPRTPTNYLNLFTP